MKTTQRGVGATGTSDLTMVGCLAAALSRLAGLRCMYGLRVSMSMLWALPPISLPNLRVAFLSRSGEADSCCITSCMGSPSSRTLFPVCTTA